MTLTFASWLEQSVFTAKYPVSAWQRNDPPVMKIEVERLPDYRWRQLGFTQPRRSREGR